MSFKKIECPVCHAMLRSKYEIRDKDSKIKKWRWLDFCPVCGTPLRLVFERPYGRIVGAEVDKDYADILDSFKGGDK